MERERLAADSSGLTWQARRWALFAVCNTSKLPCVGQMVMAGQYTYDKHRKVSWSISIQYMLAPLVYTSTLLASHRASHYQSGRYMSLVSRLSVPHQNLVCLAEYFVQTGVARKAK